VADLLQNDRQSAEAGWPGGDPEHHHPRRPVCRLPQGHRLHPAVRLPRRHAAVALGLPRGGGPAGAGGARANTPSARLRPHPGRLAPRLRSQLAADRRARASTKPSVASGACTSATARPASWPATSMSSISSSVITRRRFPICWDWLPGHWPASPARCREALTAGFRAGAAASSAASVSWSTRQRCGPATTRKSPPLALKLTYKRNISGRDIAEASVKEIRNLGIADESRLRSWGEQMAAESSPTCGRATISSACICRTRCALLLQRPHCSAVWTTRPLPVPFSPSGSTPEPARRSCAPAAQAP
jgi:hypothetical protein